MDMTKLSSQDNSKQTISKTEKDNEAAIVNTLQKALDYLHANITASVVYTDHYDYSRGVEGAEVDYFPGSVDELFTEMGITDLKNPEPLYTRAQMIEFGEKVRDECSDKCHTTNDPFKIYEGIQSINIENLLNK